MHPPASDRSLHTLIMPRRQFIQSATAATLASVAMPAAFAQGSDKINLAFVGLAHIHTPSFVSLVKSRSDVAVKSVWDHDPVRAEKVAAELSAQAVADLKEIWSDPQITAVIVCSETNRHHDIVLAAARAGKHMFA